MSCFSCKPCITFFFRISVHEHSPPDLLTSTTMHTNLLLSDPRTPERFLQQAVVPSVNKEECCACVCRWGYSKAVPLAWQRLITHTASVFVPKWGAAPLAGPICQGDPTCPRMAGRQTGWERGGCSLCLYCTVATVCSLVH